MKNFFSKIEQSKIEKKIRLKLDRFKRASSDYSYISIFLAKINLDKISLETLEIINKIAKEDFRLEIQKIANEQVFLPKNKKTA